MADDDPAINSGVNLCYSDLYRELIMYREECQDRLARLMMPPSHYDRYIQLINDYFVSGALSYAEFRIQMYYGLLLRNPNYAPLLVYWEDYDRFLNQGIQLVDSPLYAYPIILYASMGLPIVCDDTAGIIGVGRELWNQVPEPSRALYPQEIRNWEYALQHELAHRHDYHRQQIQELAWRREMARQQEMARQHQEARQWRMARQQEYHWQQMQELARQRAKVENEQPKQ